ncbi:MAG: hypothetical protein ACREWJ_02655, partial [Rhodoferax sp.]
RDTSQDAAQAPWADTAPRQVVSRQAHAWADRTDRMLVQALPAKYVSDPSFVFGQIDADINLAAVLGNAPQKQQDEMTRLLSTLMQHFGTETRVFIASLATP